jgi:hypothetical protein
VATVGANLAYGIGHGPVGALISAWPALALVGSFELLMMLIRTGRGTRVGDTGPGSRYPGCTTAGARSTTRNCRLRQPWSTPSAPGTERAAASAPSPANSTSTAARSNASSTKRYDSADGPGAQAQYASLQYRSRPLLIRLTRKLGPGGRAAADLDRCGGKGLTVTGLSGG